ncbi:YoaK family protein [uncultured Thomasclavelia sp.]|uniref:YoaK family protein n=1 Tax=uncultured Thomasclavelia sp. TaxID=3025759 RepID=UPI0025E47BF9|nr:YoaK family protein [uncultured Thomasclavelia sp.]
MSSDVNYDGLIHYTVSFVGGFFGLYAILSRCGNFGSAQTNNLICLIHDLLGNNLVDFGVRLGALVLYVLAIILTVYLPRHLKYDLRIISILIDCFACFLSILLPQDLNPIIGLYPIFFAMAFQWCTFKGVAGYVGSTTFSTNNIKQFVTAIVLYIMEKDQNQLSKMKFYGKTLLGFHLGVATVFILWTIYHIYAILLCLLPLGIVLIYIYLQQLNNETVKNDHKIRLLSKLHIIK